MRRAPLVLIVSLPKSGTHLIGELMAAFGYKVYGPSGPGGFGEPPPLDLQRRLTAAPQTIPPNTCIILHHLGLNEVSDQLAVTWHETGRPAVLFNYRDPRDVVCSYVRFLMRDTHSGGFEQAADLLAHSSILRSLGSYDERLMHAICDDTFPGSNLYRASTWLLHHPQVVNVTFERLVGSQGGGDDREQREQVAEVMAHLGIEGDPEEHARGIFRRDTPVFSKGRIGSWREEFNAEHLAAFNERYGDLLEPYGYSLVEELAPKAVPVTVG